MITKYFLTVNPNLYHEAGMTAKKGKRSVYLHREYTRSREVAGWLNGIGFLQGFIEPSWSFAVGGILNPGLPPHTPYLGIPVVFPPGQRPVSFFVLAKCRFNISFAAAAKLALVCSAAKLSLRFRKC